MADNKIDEREELTQKILAEAERLQKTDTIEFACHPGVPCFNQCCANVNILLTPLDVLRLSRRLEISTTDFLAKHTFVPFTEDQKLPFVFLQMNDDEKKTCPFVVEQGCSVYEDRPWPCRMYPVGEASPDDQSAGKGFYFLITEDHCKGHLEKKTLTIEEWMRGQGVEEYQEAGDLFKGILLNPYLQRQPLDPARMEMFYMASYDLDKFRKFVFESPFLRRFSIDDELLDQLRSDDMELLRFAFRWLRFALFGEITIPLNEELLSERERDMLKNKINR